jgi:two-component system, NtrC family, response regulator AtoC
METEVPDQPQSNGDQPRITHGEHWFVVGISPSMQALERIIGELAANDLPVLLMAETGAGKRATAERIHQLSDRRTEPFHVVASSSLVWQPGTTEQAFDSGTIFLEEVGDLNADSQRQLLEMLSKADGNGNGAAHRAARLICGTARDLESEMRSGRFREDLYYRISGVSLRLPPLRQRKEDIPHLMSFFLAKFAADYQRPAPALSSATRQLFVEYSWPGNLRELQDAARAIVALGDETLAMSGLRSLLTRPDRNNSERLSLKQAAKAASREAEKELILKVLNRTRWNRRRAAQELQISYKALLYKLKQIGYGEYGTS